MPYLADFERPLKARGRRDVPRMGEHLASLDLVPDLIVSSPAERARQTALLFAEAAGYDGDIDWDESIYGASPMELMLVLHHLPDVVEHALLIGHNPGFEELAGRLAGETPYQLTWGIRMPTAAAAHLWLQISDWHEVQHGCGQLQWVMTPKMLRERGD
jgi:phosphohistidine phosphatase